MASNDVMTKHKSTLQSNSIDHALKVGKFVTLFATLFLQLSRCLTNEPVKHSTLKCLSKRFQNT